MEYVGVTALDFLTGDALREEYENDLFVADYNNDYLYDFELSEDRTKWDLEGELVDKIANDNEELENVALGQGFGVITDIKEGPDGLSIFAVAHPRKHLPDSSKFAHIIQTCFRSTIQKLLFSSPVAQTNIQLLMHRVHMSFPRERFSTGWESLTTYWDSISFTS